MTHIKVITLAQSEYNEKTLRKVFSGYKDAKTRKYWLNEEGQLPFIKIQFTYTED